MYVATIGFFDGVHIGHQQLISVVKEIARLNNYKSLIYTFDKVAKIDKNFIYPLKSKLKILAETSVDKVIVLEFEKIKNLSPKQFFEQFILNRNVSIIVTGKNFRFGKNAAGDVNLLSELGYTHDVSVIIVDDFKVDIHGIQQVISSSLIREKILQGEFNIVEVLLGRKYTLVGKIVRGRQLGRLIGIPTINFSVESNLIKPYGVIAGFCRLGMNLYPSVGNFGYRPTIGKSEFVSEVHILNRRINRLSCSVIEFIPVKKIRNEQRFSSLEKLKEQIEKDIKIAEKILNKIYLERR